MGVWKTKMFDSVSLDCTKLNVANPCEPGQWWTEGQCANDILHLMPGLFFPSFAQVNCFEAVYGYYCLHRVMQVAKQSRIATGSAFTPEPLVPREPPGWAVRDMNPWYHICS